eukprot:m.62693 g.62693  ORF g.62693 m.62693 type:complete len:506 (+) comp19392_c0_seq4:40-1557(+)
MEFLELPLELILIVLDWLEPTALLCIQCTSASLRRLVKTHTRLWRKHLDALLGELKRHFLDPIKLEKLKLPDKILETDPDYLYFHIETPILTRGLNEGPEDWGVPSTPPHEDFGQLGFGPESLSFADEFKPIIWPLNERVVVKQVSLGGFHTMILATDGRCFSCGSGAFGQTGLGHRQSVNRPTRISSLPTNISKIACGFAFTMFLTEQPEGSLFACGFNQNGRLGLPDTKCSSKSEDDDYLVLEPQLVQATAGKSVLDVSCGSGHTVALLVDQTALAWGRNDSGQLGCRARIDDVLENFLIRVHHTQDQWRPSVVSIDEPIKSIQCTSYATWYETAEGAMMVSGGYQRLPLPVKLRDIRPSDKCWQEKVQDYSVASDFCLFKFEKTFCTLQSAFLLNLACSPPPYVFPQMVRTPAVLQDDNQIFKCSQLVKKGKREGGGGRGERRKKTGRSWKRGFGWMTSRQIINTAALVVPFRDGKGFSATPMEFWWTWRLIRHTTSFSAFE